jgi:hypothetical protein
LPSLEEVSKENFVSKTLHEVNYTKGALLLDLLRGGQASRLCGPEDPSVRTGAAQNSTQSHYSRDGCAPFSESKKSNSKGILVLQDLLKPTILGFCVAFLAKQNTDIKPF